MNTSAPTSQARIQSRASAAVRPTHRFLVGASLAALEQRGWHAEAEMDRLLKQNGITLQGSASRVALLRQTMGAAMVRVGECLAGDPRRRVSPEPTAAAATLGTAS
jgi:hypothetical protein